MVASTAFQLFFAHCSNGAKSFPQGGDFIIFDDDKNCRGYGQIVSCFKSST